MRLLGNKYIISLWALSLTFFLIFGTPVLASPGLSVEPIVLGANVAPGDSRTFTMTVSSAPGDAATDILVEAMGLGQSLGGGYRELTEGEDTSPYSARSFIDISPQEFRLEPGASQEVEITVAVPSGIGDGGRYAVIYTHTKPATQSGTSIVSAVGSSVVLTLKGTELTQAGSITDFDIGELTSGEPIEVTAVLENTGNYHYKARAEATLRDGSGNELAADSASLTGTSIVPAYSRQFDFSLSPETELGPGTYYINLEVCLEDGTLIDSRTESLEIGTTYQPTRSSPNNSNTPPSSGTNWALIIGVFAGGCILTGLLVYFLAARRRGADRW
jgi:hypothetical protein